MRNILISHRSPIDITERNGILTNSIVYLVGAIVIIVAILSFLGLRFPMFHDHFSPLAGAD